MPTKPMEQKERLLANCRLDSAGCWNWMLTKDRLGYGRLKVSMGSRSKYRTESVHRYAWELWNGAIPSDACVLHRCDNRGCFNPDHLFLGTQAQNIADMHAKGRGPRGYKRDPQVCALNAKKRFMLDAAIDAAMAQEKP